MARTTPDTADPIFRAVKRLKRRTRTVALGLALLAGCQGPASEPSALDDATRRLLYARADGVFERAMLVKPSPASEGRPGFDLAPLLLHEVRAGRTPTPNPSPVVQVHFASVEIQGERYEQRSYVWGRGRSAQGLRVTLGRDGFPAIYEVIADSSGARLIFVSETLEGAAAGEFGDPLEGRRFAVERPVEQAPDVVVAGMFEPGPMPLGPFVYLAGESSDVVTVICRCMESRVEAVVENLEYELVPIDDLDRSGLALSRLLRLPSAGL